MYKIRLLRQPLSFELGSGFIKAFQLSESEKQDLLAFLRSLTDKEFINNPKFSDPFVE